MAGVIIEMRVLAGIVVGKGMGAGLPKTPKATTSRLPLRKLTSASGVTIFDLLCGSLLSLCFFTFAARLHSEAGFSPLATTTRRVATPLPSRGGFVLLSPVGLANHNSSETPIVCLGDSLTYGVGASQGHDYPTLLSKALGTEVINAGVEGDETADALRRLDTDVLAKDPRLVIVELGANDFLDGVPLKTAFANLEAIVQHIEAQGAMAVLVGMAPGPLGEALQKDYNRIIQKYHVAFVPKVLDGIITDPRLKDNDRLHPNDQGYALIAERIRRVVEPLLTHRKPS